MRHSNPQSSQAPNESEIIILRKRANFSRPFGPRLAWVYVVQNTSGEKSNKRLGWACKQTGPIGLFPFSNIVFLSRFLNYLPSECYYFCCGMFYNINDNSRSNIYIYILSVYHVPNKKLYS